MLDQIFDVLEEGDRAAMCRFIRHAAASASCRLRASIIPTCSVCILSTPRRRKKSLASPKELTRAKRPSMIMGRIASRKRRQRGIVRGSGDQAVQIEILCAVVEIIIFSLPDRSATSLIALARSQRSPKAPLTSLASPPNRAAVTSSAWRTTIKSTKELFSSSSKNVTFCAKRLRRDDVEHTSRFPAAPQ